MEEPLEFVIARSSMGGHAWCRNCYHPDLSHAGIKISSESRGACHQPDCACSALVRMTPDEWLRWQHPGSLRTV